MPPNTDVHYCTNNDPGKGNIQSICYLLNKTADTYANHKARCAAIGGHLAAFNTGKATAPFHNPLTGSANPPMPQRFAHMLAGAEQNDVELALDPRSFYWIGVEAGTEDRWTLADGSGSVGNGLPSNARPHAHWWAQLARSCYCHGRRCVTMMLLVVSASCLPG